MNRAGINDTYEDAGYDYEFIALLKTLFKNNGMFIALTPV